MGRMLSTDINYNPIQKILRPLARMKVWLGNGKGMVSIVQDILLGLTFAKIYWPNIGLATLIFIGLISLIFLMFIGWADLKYRLFTPQVAEINTRENNLFFEKMEKDLKRQTK